MVYGLLLNELTPDEQVAAAVAPFAVAILLRLVLGLTLFTRWVVMLSTMWCAVNVLVAPYSARAFDRK